MQCDPKSPHPKLAQSFPFLITMLLFLFPDCIFKEFLNYLRVFLLDEEEKYIFYPSQVVLWIFTITYFSFSFDKIEKALCVFFYLSQRYTFFLFFLIIFLFFPPSLLLYSLILPLFPPSIFFNITKFSEHFQCGNGSRESSPSFSHCMGDYFIEQFQSRHFDVLKKICY